VLLLSGFLYPSPDLSGVDCLSGKMTFVSAGVGGHWSEEGG
jgi:hypothetical protein